MKLFCNSMVLLFFIVFSSAVRSQSIGWQTFAQLKIETKFFKNEGIYIQTPKFDEKIKSMEGTYFTLRGYFIPVDIRSDKWIILSRVPMSQCFFCGGAGPASVAMIFFKEKAPKFKTDQIITVRGKLRLNDANLDELNFILDDSELVSVPSK
ncbi:MAG TPA: hypothetical protein PLC89_02265 [Haliscomenobacter sp.]|uniref:hypothetical protein n=1 Tax=Haliscomenobacter sp. TaxID=2717303 RepID=UPI002CBDCCA2|nr:hypothetical protein [Haliscomenobacter sp.]HOY16082.1 hypothetical protein [Haliscomenobacter sp.]